MKANRAAATEPVPPQVTKCPKCGGFDLEILTAGLGGITRYICHTWNCDYREDVDPRKRRAP